MKIETHLFPWIFFPPPLEFFLFVAVLIFVWWWIVAVETGKLVAYPCSCSEMNNKNIEGKKYVENEYSKLINVTMWFLD